MEGPREFHGRERESKQQQKMKQNHKTHHPSNVPRFDIVCEARQWW